MAVSAADVSSAYQSLLGRAPDAGGLSFYQNYGNINAVKSSILGSAEYKAKGTARAPAAAVSTAQSGVDAQVAADTAARQALINKQNAEQEGLFGQYDTAIKGQEKLPDLYGRLQGELGIPGLSADVQGYKSNIYRVQNLLNTLDSDVDSRNRGFYTTQAMRDKISASEGGQLRTQLGLLGTGLAPLTEQLSGAQGQLSTLLPLYEQQQQTELDPLKMRISAISDKFAREISSFDTSHEETLNNLMDKLNRERTLSDQDWQLAQELAKEQRDYQHSLSIAQASNPQQYLTNTPKTTTPTATTNPYGYTDWSNGGAAKASTLPNIPGLSISGQGSGLSMGGKALAGVSFTGGGY